MKITNCLIHHKKLDIGGAEKSIIRMMDYLVSQNISITLVLEYRGGKLEHLINNSIKVTHLRFFEYKKNDNLVQWIFKRIINKMYRFVNQFHFGSTYYDLAIIGFQNMHPGFVAKRINAELKIHWIRSQISKRNRFDELKSNINKFSRYGFYYICVSKSVCSDFIKIFPSLKSKTEVIYNFINPDEIRNASKEFCPFEGIEKRVIVSVCRIEDKSKAVFRMLDVCRSVSQTHDNFVWYVLGDGPDFSGLMQKVEEYGLKDNFVLTGRKDNPYPYIYSADFIAILSYFEGLSGLVNESKILGKPVICTDFAGVREQIIPNYNGIIVENDTNAIVSGLRSLLNSDLSKISNSYLPEEIIDNNSKYYKMISIFNHSKKMKEGSNDD